MKNKLINRVILHRNRDKSFTVELKNVRGDGFYVKVFPAYSDIEKVMTYVMNIADFFGVSITDTN